MEICKLLYALIDYAEEHSLIEKCDRKWAINRLLPHLGLTAYTEPVEPVDKLPLEEILHGILDYAAQNGIIDGTSNDERDLFDTRIMGELCPPPREVRARFAELYKESPRMATDYFYKLSTDCDYIRGYRIKKDIHWDVDSEFGKIDLSINLSKPEKDPRAIAAARLMPKSGYPKCMLCPENEGYSGRIDHPARQNLRLVPLPMAGEDWFLQYSPYSYYNEHCIALSGEHRPMKIDRSTFVKLIDFVTYLPHYFLGSNADLPIVGGSILSHDHMQGGCYTFPMERAEVERDITFKGFEHIRAGIVKWPLSVIRLTAAPEHKDDLVELSDRILKLWRGYSDENVSVVAFSDGEPHNTITPIARRRGNDIELDLVLRCNITSEEHPMGIFHPHADKHNIKKENIGLIEVMGLAVLPARLKSEMKLLCKYVLEGKSLYENESLEKHAAWFDSFKDKYTFTEKNVEEIVMGEIGNTFVGVLSDAGVYKCTDEGRAHFALFCDYVNNNL